jgi:polysaccharide export outer membrane protein
MILNRPLSYRGIIVFTLAVDLAVTVTVTGAGAGAGILFAGCATTQPAFNYAAEPDPRKQEYVLGPSDVLKINVWRNADLSGDATVRPDGTISMPLVGDLRVAGRTPGQVQAELVQRMATFIKDESAIVTVAVSIINSYRFVVNGNVEHPGAYASNHYVTVVEAIALAGGPNRFGSPDSTVIIRPNPMGGVRRIPIDYPPDPHRLPRDPHRNPRRAEPAARHRRHRLRSLKRRWWSLGS